MCQPSVWHSCGEKAVIVAVALRFAREAEVAALPLV